MVGGRRVEVLSLSLFPCRLSPVPAAHPILKAHGPQTSSHLLYPDLTLHTEQREASEDSQHSPLSPWPTGLSGSGLTPTGGHASRKHPSWPPSPTAPPLQPLKEATSSNTQKLASLPPTPSPVITAMFYRQSLDGVSGNHFGISSIKGSNEKSISLVNR